MRKLPLVDVEWEDATSDRRWQNESEAGVIPAIIHNVGWQLQRTRKYILISSQQDVTNKEWADRTRIPRGCIKSIRRLE